MISAILDILGGIWDFITKIFDVISWLVNELIQGVTMAARALAYAVQFIGILPSVFISALVAYITIKVIFKVKG